MGEKGDLHLPASKQALKLIISRSQGQSKQEKAEEHIIADRFALLGS